MRSPLGNSIDQRRPTRHRFGVTPRYRQPHPQTPPVKNQCDDPRHQLASLQILRREARPRPLVLQLVEDILRIAAVPILLRDRQQIFLRERRHQHGILKQLLVLRQHHHSCQDLLSGARFRLGTDVVRGQRSPHHNHPPLLCPSLQLQ
jgi:hypothetical protein